MTIVSRGYLPNNSTVVDNDCPLFCQNIDLLIGHERNILNCAEYFFCNLSFAWCSWPYTSGDGQLYLGYLLLGLTTGQLIEHCPTCNSIVLITSFGGSPLTGNNGWTGVCLTCRQKQKGEQSAAFRQWMDFVLRLRQIFPAAVPEQQGYDGFDFSWGEPSLKLVRKSKTIWKPVADPVTLAVLIEELKSNNIRKSRPINVSLLKKDFELKLSRPTPKDSIHFRL
jgi:hypothetical protein